MKTLSFVVFTFVYLSLLPIVQAVVPPPDGGYPNFTTAEGDNALKALTTGVGNTGMGAFSLFSVSTGNFNTAVGAAALDLNQADSNTATGAAALLFNTTGSENTAVGTAALEFNATGASNTATGAFALFSNTTATGNTANGFNALSNHSTGDANTAIGGAALLNNITGQGNTAIGALALANCTGNGSIAIGYGAGASVASSNNVIAIGSPGDDTDNTCFIGNIRGVQTQNADAVPVLIDSSGQLGTMSSSQRFKKDIKRMEGTSTSILDLQPVTFYYKNDKTNTPQFGLVAEDVAKVNRDLVVRDKNGEIYTVRYEAVNAMLLNEFLKEHRKVEQQESRMEQQEARIADQQRQIEALTAAVQKVNAKLETNNFAPQVAKTN